MVDGTGSTGDFFISKDGKSMWKTYRYDQDVTLPSCPFTKGSYVFRGWGTSENARERYDAGSVVRNLTAEQGGAVTLYAIWDTLYFKDSKKGHSCSDRRMPPCCHGFKP